MALAKPLILVVDDDPDLRALLEHDLSGAGYDTLGYPLLSKPVVTKDLLALVRQQIRR